MLFEVLPGRGWPGLENKVYQGLKNSMHAIEYFPNLADPNQIWNVITLHRFI